MHKSSCLIICCFIVFSSFSTSEAQISNKGKADSFQSSELRFDSLYYSINDSLQKWLNKIERIQYLNSDISMPELKLPVLMKDLPISYPNRLNRLSAEIPAIKGYKIDSSILIQDSLISQIQKDIETRLQKEVTQLSEGQLDQIGVQGSSIQSAYAPEKILASTLERANNITGQAREKITEMIAQDKIDLLAINEETKVLKQAYDYMPNSNDLSSAKKRSSLSDQPMGGRLSFAANFSLSSLHPFMLDLNPSLGYRMNKLFEVGIIGTVNVTETKKTAAYNYGGGAFIVHDVWKNFFGYMEYQFLKSYATETGKQDLHGLLGGIGYEIPLSHVMTLQTQMLYNFSHDNSIDASQGPVIFRTGVRFTNMGAGKGKEKLKFKGR